MNWYVRGKLAFVVIIAGPVAFIWLMDSVLHVGLYDWLERTFGYDGVLYILIGGFALLFVALNRALSHKR